MYRYLFAAASICFGAAPVYAATVTATIDFTSGSVVNAGGGVKNYIEDDFVFYDARIVGGPCADTGADKCAALNKNEVTRLEQKDGLAFDLSSIWFYLNGKAEDTTNALRIYDALNPSNVVLLNQATYAHNTGYDVPLGFVDVTALIFESGGSLFGKSKDQGNARFDSLKLSYRVPDQPPTVPLPASFPLLLGAVGAFFVKRRK